MYHVSPITDRLFGFRAIEGYLEPWVAIAQIADGDALAAAGADAYHADKPDCLELCARVFLPEMEGPVQYEGLLEAVRSFSKAQMSERGCESCLIYYTCRGIVDAGANLPLPGMPYAGGRLAVECEFVETFTSEQDKNLTKGVAVYEG